MRRLLSLVAGCAGLLAAGSALPCGGAFGNNIQVDPKQDIVVAWKAGVETYVFQPTFCGPAGDFGLILPVPAQLSREPQLVDQAVFTKAIALSEPKKVKLSSSGPIGCGSADSGGSNGVTMDDGPTVVASGRVGFLDWVQLKADSVASFTDWLTANGYPYSDEAKLAFAYYVSQAWYFLAFRISQELTGSGTVCRALGPVSLTFPADGPVVPVRMGSINVTVPGSSQFAWRLFGISPGDIQLSNGELAYSGAIKDSDVSSFGGLAQAGDRLTRFYLRFNNGSTTYTDHLGRGAPSDFRATEYVPDDSGVCSVARAPIARHTGFLVLTGLAFAGLLVWRRRR